MNAIHIFQGRNCPSIGMFIAFIGFQISGLSLKSDATFNFCNIKDLQ